MNTLKVNKILIKNNIITYDYEFDGLWNKYLINNEKLYLEFDKKIDDVSSSIAIIPLLVNILPIAWIFDLNIEIDSLDQTFFNNIELIKKGYINMYPKFSFLGNLKVDKLEYNSYQTKKCGTLFSGGVDAFNTLINHINRKPDLLTVWGADVDLNDTIGWKNVCEANKKVAEKFKLNFHYIKSNFRKFINYKNLSKFVSKKIDGEWWHEFQHGIGIIGLFAPLAYINQYDTLYIASSMSSDLNKPYTCASDPSIDNYVNFGQCQTIHDAFDMTRQDKVRNICKYFEKNKINDLPLRVCWQSSGGKNCCNCEKCFRTILEILVEKYNPNNYGFCFNDETKKLMSKKMPKMEQVKYDSYAFYSKAQITLKKNYQLEEIPNYLQWLVNYKFHSSDSFYFKYFSKIFCYPKKIIIKIHKKLLILSNKCR